MNEEATNEATEEKVDEIRVAFDAAISADKSEDDVKMAMIGAGATFKNVTRLYNQYSVDAGLAMSKAEKDEVVTKIVSKAKKLETEEGFNKTVAAIVEATKGVNEKSAAALIRAWAKAQDPAVETWAKPKSAGGSREGFRSRFYDALVANPAMTKEQCHDFIVNDKDSSANKLKHEANFQGMRGLANRIWEKANGGDGDGQAKAA